MINFFVSLFIIDDIERSLIINLILNAYVLCTYSTEYYILFYL